MLPLQNKVYETWINVIKKAMADNIHTYFAPLMGGDVNIHTEEMEQGFERPAFFILMGYTSTDKGMNKSWTHHYSMRVRYHADDKRDTNSTESEYDELSAVGEMLTECLEELYLPVGNINNSNLMLVRADNVNYAPSENKKVLIYQTTYHLSLYQNETSVPMLDVDVDTHVREGVLVVEEGEN